MGVLSKDEAVKEARSRELDLVLIGPNAEPPVAKILDFSKFLYEEKKKKVGSKGKKSELKEFRLGPTTGEGDVQRIVLRCRGFIKDGNRVKISVVLRGRENLYPNLAFEKVNKIINDLSDVARPEAEPKQLGGTIFAVIVPK